MDYNVKDILLKSYSIEAIAWAATGIVYFISRKISNSRKSGVEKAVQSAEKTE